MLKQLKPKNKNLKSWLMKLKNSSIKLTTRKKPISTSNKLRCKDKRKKYLKKYSVKFTNWLKSTTIWLNNFKLKPDKLARFQVPSTKRTKVMKDQRSNSKKFWVNSTILTIFSEMWLKEQVSMARLMKSYPKFLRICKDLLQQEGCKLNNLRTVLRREDSELDRIFLQCIQINHLHKILDFSFLHQWFSQHNLKIKTCTKIKIRAMTWVKCWQIF